jgi:hypothetical protein
MGDDDQRTAYIGKELDRESELGDHGIRKVDYGLGRFTTCDLRSLSERSESKWGEILCLVSVPV